METVIMMPLIKVRLTNKWKLHTYVIIINVHYNNEQIALLCASHRNKRTIFSPYLYVHEQIKVHVNDPQETTEHSTTTALLLYFIESQLDHTYYNLWANQRWLCLASAKGTVLLPDFIFCSFLLHMDISYTNYNYVPKKCKNDF